MKKVIPLLGIMAFAALFLVACGDDKPDASMKEGATCQECLRLLSKPYNDADVRRCCPNAG